MVRLNYALNNKDGLFKSIAWATIFTQLLFPLAITFTPAVAVATTKQHFLTHKSDVSTLSVRPYVLQKNESIYTVAQQFNITVTQLRELNQFRIFKNGFDHLQPGEELDVPVTPLPMVVWKDDRSAAEQQQDPARKVAVLASRVGSFFTRHPNSEKASLLTGGIVTSEVSRQIQQWLNRFGTARIELNTGKNFSFNQIHLDLLTPLYEQQDRMFFTQSSLHRTDNRTQANLGAGLRWFHNDWMLGANTFLDYDLSRDHARMGTGVEYWRNTFKLSANNYLRLTTWKNSPELEDYEERPANGWDIRAEGWLPALPQLSGKLTYEQYYGEEVALFGKDNRQRNPHAITAGLNYTPFPLLSFGAEQRQGKSGVNDTRFSVALNYQLGIPWRQQFDPAAMISAHNLAGSRYDLVNRNNNIVLEYRKKQLIKLYALDNIQGYAGEKKNLGIAVTTKYPLDYIDWYASDLLAHGGKIVHEGPVNYSLILPDYQEGNDAANIYTIGAVAYDNKGNASQHATIHIHVTQSAISAQDSHISPLESTLTANGQDSTTLTLAIRDKNNLPINVTPGEIDIAVTPSGKPQATISKLQKTDNGVYTFTVTASTHAETLTLTPTIRGSKLQAAKVNIIAGEMAADKSTLKVKPAQIVADGKQQATLTFTTRDHNDNAISGIASQLGFSVTDSSGKAPAAGKVTISTVQESSSEGTYTATLTGSLAGSYSVTPQYAGSAVGKLNAQVTLTAGTTPDGSQSTFTAAPQAIAADNSTAATLTFIAKDSFGNAISGIASQLGFSVTDSGGKAPAAGRIKVSKVTESSSEGTYTATLTGSLADSYSVTPQYAGSAVGKLNAQVEIVAKITGLEANGYTFGVAEGFPETAYAGSHFTVKLTDGVPASDYQWSSSQSWVSVDNNGTIAFTAPPTSANRSVTITARSKVNNKALTYQFSLKTWFVIVAGTNLAWQEADTACKNSGYQLPDKDQLTTAAMHDYPSSRGTGNFWGEWGEEIGGNVWTGTHYVDDYYFVNLSSGRLSYASLEAEFRAEKALCAVNL